MSMQRFTVESLATLDDGRIKAAIEHAVQRCVADCRDRPGARKARKVKLEMVFTPVADDRGDLSSVMTSFDISDTAPKRQSRTFDMGAMQGDQLMYQELSPEDHRQAELGLGNAPSLVDDDVDDITPSQEASRAS